MAPTIPETMRAVIFKGDFHVEVEDKAVPKIRDPTDAILKVSAAGLCGSDLHYYRGHQETRTPGFICGHEFVGHIAVLGDAVKTFAVGDHVVVPFYTACGECFFCKRGEASRCPKGELFGNSYPPNTVDGGQAEYVRVPLADSTLVKAPNSISEEILILMADVFPTGYFAAGRFLKDLPEWQLDELTTVVVGCGPVGICAIASALHFTGGRGKIFAVDSVPERLDEAAKLGAVPLQLNENPVDAVKKASGGRGADLVLEVVGHADALQLAFDMIRPFGKISSVGVHTQDVKFQGPMLYGKNVTMAFGRCPVRSLFEESLAVLGQVQDKVKFLVGKTMSLEEAPEAFKLFEQRKVHKIVFTV